MQGRNSRSKFEVVDGYLRVDPEEYLRVHAGMERVAGGESLADVADDVDETTEDPESGEEVEIFCRAMFSHSLSPKPPGETFTVRWEFEIDDEEAFKDGSPYPFFPL